MKTFMFHHAKLMQRENRNNEKSFLVTQTSQFASPYLENMKFGFSIQKQNISLSCAYIFG